MLDLRQVGEKEKRDTSLVEWGLDRFLLLSQPDICLLNEC